MTSTLFTDHLAAWLVILPLLCAPVMVLLNRSKLVWLLNLVVSASCLIIALHILWDVSTGTVIHYAMGGWTPPWGIEYRIDGLNALVAVIVSAMATACAVYARKSVEQEISVHVHGLFYAAFQLCFLGLLGIALTGDIFNLFVFLEISSLASYALIAMGRNRKALNSAFHYLILGTLGATFFLIGVGLAFAATGTLNMADMALSLQDAANTPLLLTAFALIVVGVALKAAIYPLHLWLPGAYAYAPSVVSVFLAATATKVAIYVLIRCLFSVFEPDYMLDTFLPDILVVLGGVAILYGSLRAIYQEGMKKMLAYSSVAQIGYMVMGIGFLSAAGLTASLLHMFNHALMKGAMFMAVGLFVYRVNTATFDNLKGMGREMPYTFFAMVLAALSLVGVPGTVGFVSKWQLLQAALENRHWGMVMIILLGSLMAAIYVWKLIEVLYFQQPEKLRVQGVSSGSERIGRSPAGMVIALWVMALGCVYFGLDTDLSLHSAQYAVTELLQGRGN
ncbi:monovalent cation/H+ antiporter subunit D family protein [Aestuariibacter halophilus]|uniref:Monovalent cation/H+ antiporter subunit D family protein n=1 Tax=Fluctibacter halophilus TaxID=226011 RepID=A0ABS8G6P9_9ALTE|nr:monovalent cation/H+ antiporter subunit D family protein [Aestuariibacter halophilus]MCC2616272.1 monovalent cation/H+ antiporter subunit D family protein [Aestuariibacter halophilus]